MPAGMLLKSYPWAFCLSDPKDEFSAKSFSADRALPYHDEMMPLPVERFIEYGETFATRYVPSVERKMLVSPRGDLNRRQKDTTSQPHCLC